MAIKALSVKDLEAQDLTKFRNLAGVIRFLSRVKNDVDADTKLLGKYSRLLVSATSRRRLERAAKGVFTIDGDDNSPALVKPRIQLQTKEFKEAAPQLEVIDRMQDRLALLTSMENQLETEFRGDKLHDAVVKALKALKKEVTTALNAAHTKVSKVVLKSAPPKFMAVVDEIRKRIEGTMSDNFSTVVEKNSMLQGEDTITYFRYIGLKDFVNDSDVHYPQLFYVILACRLDVSANTKFYISTSPSFVAPTKVSLKHEFDTAKKAIAKLDDLLELENFSGLIADHPSPYEDPSSLPIAKFKAKDLIEQIKTGPEGVTIMLTNAVDDAAEARLAMAKLKPDMAALYSIRHQGVVKSKVLTLPKDRFAIQFMFSPNPSSEIMDTKLSRGKLRAVQINLGLSDDQINRISAML